LNQPILKEVVDRFVFENKSIPRFRSGVSGDIKHKFSGVTALEETVRFLKPLEACSNQPYLSNSGASENVSIAPQARTTDLEIEWRSAILHTAEKSRGSLLSLVERFLGKQALAYLQGRSGQCQLLSLRSLR
jgi:hypothetical protein